jgi:hypothetical protein
LCFCVPTCVVLHVCFRYCLDSVLLNLSSIPPRPLLSRSISFSLSSSVVSSVVSCIPSLPFTLANRPAKNIRCIFGTVDLGDSLLAFFDFYGHLFDFSRAGLSPQLHHHSYARCFFSLPSSGSSSFVVADPLDPHSSLEPIRASNIAGGVFAVHKIKGAFAYAAAMLQAPSNNASSTLSRIIRGSLIHSPPKTSIHRNQQPQSTRSTTDSLDANGAHTGHTDTQTPAGAQHHLTPQGSPLAAQKSQNPKTQAVAAIESFHADASNSRQAVATSTSALVATNNDTTSAIIQQPVSSSALGAGASSLPLELPVSAPGGLPMAPSPALSEPSEALVPFILFL